MDKQARVDKKYVLSDSSVNVYGFRLLTSGYVLAEYAKNPIGYHMHEREEGVVVKWEDLKVEGDQVTGYPVINLSNERGQQTYDECMNGFLNAASVGHIVVLEWSMEPENMLPGQTGPTITKWYNKECSLVDIPGNCNALTELYDTDNNALNLADLSKPTILTTSKIDNMKVENLTAEALGALNLADNTDAVAVSAAIVALSDRATTAEKALNDLKAENVKEKVKTLLADALAAKKLTVELSAKLEKTYGDKPEELKDLLDAMPAYQSIADRLKAEANEGEGDWKWDDYEKNDPSGKKLADLKANNRAKYDELFNAKFKS